MNTKKLLIMALMAMYATSTWAYDFSAIAPTGQTLYYNIIQGGAEVVSQNTTYPYYTTRPTGALTIPDSVTFNGITYAVTSIGSYAFEYCSGLTSVTIPDGITSIGKSAFFNCVGLTTFNIPNGVTSISSFAFYLCSSLTSITIPNSVTTIYADAFYGCSSLRVMRMKPATPPTLFNYSSICDSIIDLVAPHNSYYAYTQAGVKYTKHHIFADSAFVTITVNNNAWGYVTGCANDTVFTYPYSDTAEIELVATPYPGYHFVRWDDYTTDSIRTITNIIHDITVKAHFAHDHNNDIDDVETLNAKVYSSQRQIVVEGAEGNMVTLYDVNGRMLTAKQDHDMPLLFDVPASGTYLVKIGNHPARKVIVVR